MSAPGGKNEKKDEVEVKGSEDQAHLSSPQGRYVRLETRLGAGAYKDVWRAYDSIEGIEVAWNVVKLSRVPKSERKRIKTEVKLLKGLEHPNVIKYFNSWVNREREEIIFVTEIMSSGSLKEYIKKNPMIRWNAVKRWCRQILKGLEFLHKNSIIHRDIKCDNIFINGSTGDIRIGDLGLSTKMAEGRDIPNSNNSKDEELKSEADPREITGFAMTCLGTPEFMAPELYDENYNEMVDVYAFGMTCLEMVTSKTPYHKCTSAPQIYKKVVAGELPPELELVRNKNAREFIEACIQPKATRPTASQLLGHPFLQENEKEDFLEVRVKLKKDEMKEEKELDRVNESDQEDESSDDDDDDVTGDEGILRKTIEVRSDSSAIKMESDQKAVIPKKLVPSPENSSGDHVPSPTSMTGSPVSKCNTTSTEKKQSPEVNCNDPVTVKDSSRNCESNHNLKQFQASIKEEIRSFDDASVAQDEQRLENYVEARTVAIKGLSSGSVGSRVLRVYDEGVFRSRSGSIGGGTVGMKDDQEGLTRSQPIPIPNVSNGNINSLDTVLNETGVSQLQASAESFVGVVDLEDKDTNCESLIFRLRVPYGDTFKEVEFEFNLQEDDPVSIVQEMNETEELVFMRPYAQEIVDSLTPVVDVAKRIAQEKAIAKELASQQRLQLGAPYDIVLSSNSTAAATASSQHQVTHNIELQQKDDVLAKYSNSPLSEMVIEKVLATPGVCDDRSLAALGERIHKANLSLNIRPGACTTKQPISSEVSGAQSNFPNKQPSPRSPSKDLSLSTDHCADDSATSSPILPFGDLETSEDSIGLIMSDESTKEDLAHYNEYMTRFNEGVAKIEKEYSHVTSNLNSQGEKLLENYTREYDKIINRKNDLTKQLHAMEEKYKERMLELDKRREKLYETHMQTLQSYGQET